MPKFTITRLLEVSTVVCVAAAIVAVLPPEMRNSLLDLLWIALGLCLVVLAIASPLIVVAVFYYSITWTLRLLRGPHRD